MIYNGKPLRLFGLYIIIDVRGDSMLRKLLDKMFGNKKLSFMIPMILALLIYLLFVLFGTAENKINLMIVTPIVSIICFLGVFFVVYVQVKNSMCPDWFLNLFEFLITIIFGGYAIIAVLSFIISGFQNFNVGMCIGFVAYSAISLAHNKRMK